MQPKHLLKKLSLGALALLALPTITQAGLQDRLYDFTDAYYFENGVNPAAISGRRQPGPSAAEDTPIFWYQRNVRALITSPAYDQSGNIWYFSVMGGASANTFTADAVGQRERQLADSSSEYVFPKRGTNPVGLGAARQSVILDMRNGYFSNNRIGAWIHVWVSYTDKALNTADGLKMMNDLAAKNGRDLDGTAIIRSVSDIDNLSSKGYITKTVRPESDSLRYAFCPVIKDPRDGGIAPDQFLSYPRKADGSPLEPWFVQNFESLRLTGRPAN
jgi:hypothetical protein